MLRFVFTVVAVAAAAAPLVAALAIWYVSVFVFEKELLNFLINEWQQI